MPKPIPTESTLHRLSVDIPEDLFNTVTKDLGFGNLRPLVLNLFKALERGIKGGQPYLVRDIAAGKDVRVVVD